MLCRHTLDCVSLLISHTPGANIIRQICWRGVHGAHRYECAYDGQPIMAQDVRYVTICSTVYHGLLGLILRFAVNPNSRTNRRTLLELTLADSFTGEESIEHKVVDVHMTDNQQRPKMFGSYNNIPSSSLSIEICCSILTLEPTDTHSWIQV